MGFIAGLFLLASAAQAETQVYDTPSSGPVPRWAMMSKSEVNARSGPSKDNRIVWTYHAVNLPVQIISETHDWRLICDPDGDVAWVSRGLLRNSKTVLSLTREKLPMHDDPTEASPVRAILRGQALAQLDKCKKDWCRIKVNGVSGWVPQSSLWGTQDKAICQRPDPLAAR